MLNDLVRKLAEESGSTHKQSLGVYQFYEGELEDFVRKIISECANALVDNELWSRHVGHAWREHFGDLYE